MASIRPLEEENFATYDVDEPRIRRAVARQAEASPTKGLQPERRHGAAPQASSAGDLEASTAMTEKIKSCLVQLEAMKEELRGMRQDHVNRIEEMRVNRTEQEAEGERSQSNKSLRVSRTRNQAKLQKLKSRAMNPEDIKSSLRSFEQNKAFLRLPKQEQLKKHLWNRGVPARDVKKYLEDELEQEQACIGLIWAVLMLLFFCMGVFQHMRLEQVHAEDWAAVEDVSENANFAFSGSIPFENGRMGHKGLDDINNIPDFWSWMNLGFVPLLFPNEGVWDTSEPRANVAAACNSFKEALAGHGGYSASILAGTSDTTGIHGNIVNESGDCPETGMAQPSWPEGFLGPEGEQGHTYLYYHTIVAGARMRQEENTYQKCPDQDLWLNKLFTGKCVPTFTPNYLLEPEPFQAFFPAQDFVQSNKTVFLKAHTSQADLRSQLKALENQAWLTPKTAKVEIVFTTYNPHLNAMTVLFLNFFFNRAGHIHKVIEPITFFLDPYSSWQNYLWDILWVLMVVKLAYDEIPDIYQNIKEHRGIRKGLKAYLSLGNLIDWINIAYSITICIVWAYHITNVQVLNDQLLKADVKVQGSWPTDKERNDFYDQAGHVSEMQYSLRRFLTFYPLVVVSKFFKVFNSSPRLALMTNTMQKASTDIVHFAVVFFTVFFIYVLSGMLLFGQEVLAFSNIFRASDETFKIVMGNFDWEELRRIGRVEAFIWFFTFNILVILIMLNMLLALIIDVYNEVKSALPNDADTIWSQLWEVYERKRDVWTGTRVPLRVIRAEMPEEEDCEDGEPEDLDFIRYIAMSPEADNGDDTAVFRVTRGEKADDDGLQFKFNEDDCTITIAEVNEQGAACTLRLKEDQVTPYSKDSDEATMEPCFEGYQVTHVRLNEVMMEVKDPLTFPELRDVMNEQRTYGKPSRSFTMVVKKTSEANEDSYDIEGLTNTLRELKLSKDQAKKVLEAALRHAEEGKKDGSSISESNARIATIGDVLDEVQDMAQKNWDLVTARTGVGVHGSPARS